MRENRTEREKCCDETAIAHFGAKAGDFGSAIADILSAEHKSTQPIPSLAVAGPVKNIENRIKPIMKPDKTFHKHAGANAVITILLLALVTVPTSLVLSCRPAKNNVFKNTPKKVELAFEEFIGAVREDDTVKLEEIALRRIDANDITDTQKLVAFALLNLEARALQKYSGIEDLEIYRIEEKNGRTTLLTSEVTDTLGVKGRLCFGVFGEDTVYFDAFAFVTNDGRRLGILLEILINAYIVSVPPDMPQLKGIVPADGSGSLTQTITPEELEEFLEVVRNTPRAKILCRPKILTNEGGVGKIRTTDEKLLYSRLNIRNTVGTDRKTIRVEFDLEYTQTGADGRKTTSSIVNDVFVLSEQAIVAAVLDSSVDKGDKLLWLIKPEIVEWKSSMIGAD